MFLIDWTLVGEIVGLLALIGKGVHYLWKKFDQKNAEIEKLRNENEELKIHAARQAAVLEMTSNYLKKTMSEGLENFVEKNDK